MQWENSQLTVIGVGRHRLWLQKISNGNFEYTSYPEVYHISGDMVGFTRDTLHQLNSKNALRLLKKTNLFKTTIKCIWILNSSLIFLLVTNDFKSSKTLNSSTANLNSINFSVDELDDEEYMKKILLQELGQWTLDDDSALIQVDTQIFT